MAENEISVRQAAKILGVTVPMVHYCIVHEQIRPIGRFGNAFVLDRNAIENFKLQRERERSRQ
jgi:hypothetical protein